MIKPAVIGALALSAALVMQDYIQGDTPNLVQVIVRLFLGALIGIGVSKFVSRRNRQQ